MKVVAVNGSPRQNGNTAYALSVMGDIFKENGIDFEILQIGAENIHGCTACLSCYKTGTCALNDDAFNGYVDKLKNADGMVLAAPIYFANIAGTMKSFLDRVFYAYRDDFYHKVGGAFATVRRTGGIAGFDTLNHYMSISEMLIAPMPYWGVVHGRAPMEVLEDEEGLAIVSRMAKNMVWLLKLKEAGSETVEEPTPEVRPLTSFVR